MSYRVSFFYFKEKKLSEDFDKVKPSEFFLTIKGTKRRIRFGNLALAKLEEKYGSVKNFDKLEEELTEKPMSTIPWLLSICMKDREGIGDTTDDMLEALDDSKLTVMDAMKVISEAMQDSLGKLSGNAKKKTTAKK